MVVFWMRSHTFFVSTTSLVICRNAEGVGLHGQRKVGNSCFRV